MPTNFLWGDRQSAVDLLVGSELNSLANAYGCAASPAIDLTASKWMLGDLGLYIASSSLAFTSASYADVYFLTSPDGTNYPKYTSGASPKIAGGNYFAGRIWIHPASLSSEAIYEVLTGVRIPNAKFKVALINGSGVTWPSSGNWLKLWPTPQQY